MAENQKVGIEIDINTSDIEKLRQGLAEAEKKAEALKSEFGEGSKEFKSAAETVDKVKKRINELGDESKKSVGEIKKALIAAKQELIAAQDKFGDYSQEAVNAAKRVAELKDKFSEAAETANLFDPGKKFQALTGSIQAVAGGFSAVQGALGLVGVESENVQKQLLKVQSALALSQGLSTITDSAKEFKRLSAIIQQTTLFKKADAAATALATKVQTAFGVAVNTTSTSFKVLKAAIVSTGIGALVVAIGFVVEAIMNWADSTEDNAKAQEQLNAELERQNQITQENIKAANESTEINILKAKIAGASEKEITQLQREGLQQRQKIYKQEYDNLLAQLDNFIKTTKLTGDAYIKAKKEIDDKIKGNVEKQGQEISELNKLNLNEELANENKKRDAAKASADKAKAQREKDRADRLQAEKDASEKLKELAIQKELEGIKDAYERRKREIAIQLQDELNQLAANTKIKEETRVALERAIKDKYAAENAKNDEDKKKEDEAKRAEELAKIRDFEAKANDIRTAVRLAGIENEGDRSLEELLVKYQKEREAILAEEKLTEEQRIAQKKLLGELDVQYEQEKQKLLNDIKRGKFDEDFAKLEKIAEDPEQSFKAREEALAQETALIQNAFAQRTLTEEQYLNKRKEIADAEKKLEAEKLKQTLDAADAVASTLGGLANLFGKNTRAGKVFAIAEATINTFTSAVKAYNATVGIPVVGPVLAPINAGIAVAAGIKNIREIQKVKIPGGDGGGGNVPSVSAPIAPPVPQVATTKLDSQTINKIGQASRSYVLESDVTDSQEKQRRINRAARLS